MTQLSCQVMQTEMLHEDTGSHKGHGEPCEGRRNMGSAAEDSSGLAEAEEYKSQTCKHHSIYSKGNAAPCCHVFSLKLPYFLSYLHCSTGNTLKMCMN